MTLLCMVALSGCSGSNETETAGAGGGDPTSSRVALEPPFDDPAAKTGAIAVDPTPAPPAPSSDRPPTVDPTIALTPLPSSLQLPPEYPPPPPASSGSAVVTDVHVEKHDKFDRVIYAFGGHGIATWKIEYVAEAVQYGTSDIIKLRLVRFCKPTFPAPRTLPTTPSSRSSQRVH